MFLVDKVRLCGGGVLGFGLLGGALLARLGEGALRRRTGEALLAYGRRAATLKIISGFHDNRCASLRGPCFIHTLGISFTTRDFALCLLMFIHIIASTFKGVLLSFSERWSMRFARALTAF